MTAHQWFRIGNGLWTPAETVTTPSLPTFSAPLGGMSHSSWFVSSVMPPSVSKEEPVPNEPEVVQSDMPILARRAALIGFDRRGLWLRPLHFHEPFGIDADAVCNKSSNAWGVPTGKPQHLAPHLDCACGFYAVPGDVKTWGQNGSVDLGVELSGRVIEHETGYRAEHQRVYQMVIPRCPLCDEPSQFVIIRHAVSDFWGCRSCFGHIKPKAKRLIVDREMLQRHIPVPQYDADARPSRS